MEYERLPAAIESLDPVVSSHQEQCSTL